MDTYKADIVCFGWKNFSDNGNARSIRNDFKFDMHVYTDWFEAKKYCASIYARNKIYRKDLIAKNEVKFCQEVKISDDE